MNSYYLFISLFILNLSLFSQDELIFRNSEEVTDYNLKIKKISKDSLFYKAFMKNYSVKRNEVVAYRYKNKDWQYIDSNDYKKYWIVDKKLIIKYKQPDYILKKYRLADGVKQMDLIRSMDNYKIILTTNEKEYVLKQSQWDIGFSLDKDSLKYTFICELLKIKPDTLYFKGNFNAKWQIWKIPITDILNLNFQTDFQKALKITTGTLTAIATSGVYAGINIKKKINTNDQVKLVFVKDKD